MEIKVTETPTTGAYQGVGDGPNVEETESVLVLDNSNRISFVIGGTEQAWVTGSLPKIGLHGTKVWGAVGNDLADEVEVDNKVDVEPGKAYVFVDGKVRPSSKKAEKGFIGIATNTASLVASNKDDNGDKITVAVAGFVPAFVDKQYVPGTPLTITKDGVLTKAGFITRLFTPERIVASYYKKSRLSSWSGVSIKDRVLVKVV